MTYIRIRNRMLVVSMLALLSLLFGQVTLAAAQGQDDPKPADPEPVSVEELFKEPKGYDKPEKHSHPIPDRPVIIDDDGVKRDPKEITKFNGKPLNLLINDDAEAKGAIYVFTSSAKLRKYLEKHNNLPSDKPRKKPTAGDIEPLHYNWNDPYSYFYEHAGFGGCRLALHIGHAYSDLTKVGCGVFWWWSLWNDRISSVSLTPQGWGTVLWEHTNWGGSRLILRPGADVTNLGWYYNFDNRASSIAVYY